MIRTFPFAPNIAANIQCNTQLCPNPWRRLASHIGLAHIKHVKVDDRQCHSSPTAKHSASDLVPPIYHGEKPSDKNISSIYQHNYIKNQSINQFINSSTNPSINKSINQSNQSINQSMYSINWLNQPINQSTNRSTENGKIDKKL